MPSMSTVEAVGDLHRGLMCETSTILATACWESTDHQAIFNTYGRILLLELYGEITTNMAGAAQPNFSYTGITPASTGITDLCLVSASVAALVVGNRVEWPGGAVGETLIITATSPYLSPMATGVGFLLGGVSATGVAYVGLISADGSVSSATSGGVRFTCCYVPMSDGAYVSAAV
jgi:hypothetical protein